MLNNTAKLATTYFKRLDTSFDEKNVTDRRIDLYTEGLSDSWAKIVVLLVRYRTSSKNLAQY